MMKNMQDKKMLSAQGLFTPINMQRAEVSVHNPQINQKLNSVPKKRSRKVCSFLRDFKTIFMSKEIKSKISKKFFALAAMILAAVNAFAQGNGMAGINDATNLVSGYFDPVTKLIYAIGAFLGLVGGVKVYSKFQSGDPDTSKTAASWFGGCIFLIVTATVLRSFFL